MSGQALGSLALAWLGATAAGARHFSGASQMVMIKTLREKSGAPISDVKSSLVASGWDIAKAFDVLREKGLAAAAKKASRHASEGLVGLAAASAAVSSAQGPAVAIVEINSETDFVARSDVFRSLVSQVAMAALTSVEAERPSDATPGAAAASASGAVQQLDEAQLAAVQLPGSCATAGDACAEVAAQVRENVRLRRAFLLRGPPGSVAGSYLHMSPAPGLGTIASAVLLQPPAGVTLGPDAAAAAAELASGLAMHAAGMRPLYLRRESIPPEVLDHEAQVLTAQASVRPVKARGRPRPAAMVTKMVQGQLAKFYEEVCLVEQRYLLDDGLRVREAVQRLSKQIGQPLDVSTFLRVQCGEGLDATSKTDFATEVARMVNN